MTEATQTTEATQATRSHTFNFKVIPTTSKLYETNKPAFVAHGIPFVSLKGEGEQKDIEVGIKREALTVNLPVYALSDFPESFLIKLINSQVEQAAKKLVDRLKPVTLESLTPAEVITLMESSETAGSGISKELIADAKAFVTAVLTAAKLPIAKIQTIVSLLENKFNSKILKANAAILTQVPAIFNILTQVYGKSEEKAAAHQALLEACVTNYQSFMAQGADDTGFEVIID